MRSHKPHVLWQEFRRFRAPDDPTQLPDLPSWLRTGGAPSSPVPAPAAAPAPQIITPSMAEVMRVVTRLGSMQAEMPNNPRLGQLVGGRGRSSVLRALRRLAQAALIVVEHRGSQRRVIIMATGRATDWGEARPGHAPYLHRMRGEPAVERPRAPRRPHSRPLVAQTPNGTRYQPPLVHGTATTCQWPMWPDGERPGPKPLFCGKPCAEDLSFCAGHGSEVYRKRAASTQPKGTGVGKTTAMLKDPRFSAAIVAIIDLDYD